MLNRLEIYDILNKTTYRRVREKKEVYYYDIICSFDIEVSSFLSNHLDKACCMYVWSMAIYDKVIIGRTWEEFLEVIDIIKTYYNISNENRFIIFVHNLAYEFQFIRKFFQWETVFALDKRKPIKALTVDGIEFRCSYQLSGYGLAKLADNLIYHDIKKLVGDLDYRLVRTSKTPLTEQELNYSKNDVLIVTAYIEERIKECGNITKLPLTKTGFVRNYMRQKCLYGDGNHKNNDTFKEYRKLMREMTLTPDIYKLLRDSFSGGFTHANAMYSGEILHNIKSYDFTSSYPAVMVSEKFPMSKFEKVEITDSDQFDELLSKRACLITVQMIGLKSTTLFENYISKSHCSKCINAVENNGRIVSADLIEITITEQDMLIIFQMYDWEDMNIIEMYTAEKGYLPKAFIEGVLDLYEKKTTLKEVEGKEAEYMRSKENINSTFGMCVTDICREEVTYNDDLWGSEKPDLEKSITKYNKSIKRFLYYAWGVWITAYARTNLFTGILEFKDDYVYSDTDSIKVMNYKKHKKYIDTYNRSIIYKIDKCLKYYNIDPNKARPKNKKGLVKQLGVWNEEELYTTFKTLGAKRYMIEVNNKISLTVSGVNKHKAVPYLYYKYKDNETIFRNFSENLEIPAEYKKDGEILSATGKLTHTYLDEELCGEVVDYLGNKSTYHELSGIHMQPADYKLTLLEQYVNYILGIKEETFISN